VENFAKKFTTCSRDNNLIFFFHIQTSMEISHEIKQLKQIIGNSHIAQHFNRFCMMHWYVKKKKFIKKEENLISYNFL
jgi:hypothetical protein